MVYESKPYKSAKQLARESIEEFAGTGDTAGSEGALVNAITAVFEYAQHVEERFDNMCEVNNLWDGS